jgi:chromosome partition protein MukB
MERARTICARLEEEEPEEVLQGRVDFGKSEELAQRVRTLDDEKERTHQALLRGERKTGELSNRYRSQGAALARSKSELKRIEDDLGRALKWWNEHYPDKPTLCLTPGRSGEREHHKAVWESLVVSLRARLLEVSQRYDLKISSEEQPDALVPQLLQWLLPPGVELDQLEAQYTRLQHELQQIEQKIRGHVESIRATVESEIRHLRMHLVRVNHILSSLRFGQIEKISLEIDELPAYKALGKLESVLRLLQRKEVVTLKEFIEQLRAFLLKEANVQLTEEQIADYRSYVRIRRVIVDKEGRTRETGLSSGETLGVNLALCLAILFFLGRERGGKREHAMLLLALDEAERLDARALESIRELLNSVRCQLTVAMPRPVEIPDSVCHLLTPLPQGVTHIRLYRQNGNGTQNVDRGQNGSGAQNGREQNGSVASSE